MIRGPVESRMRGNAHVRFGGAGWGDGPWKTRHTRPDPTYAETIIGLYKAELIRRRGPWRGIDDVEYATLEWVDWFNHRRLMEPIGHGPPAEYEAAWHRKEDSSCSPELTTPSLR
jgi:transposase InsO family protein